MPPLLSVQKYSSLLLYSYRKCISYKQRHHRLNRFSVVYINNEEEMKEETKENTNNDKENTNNDKDSKESSSDDDKNGGILTPIPTLKELIERIRKRLSPN